MTDSHHTDLALPKQIAEAIDQLPYRIGLASQDLATGNRFSHNQDEVFAQASAIKIPILWQLELKAERGELSLDERLLIDPSKGAGGCGILQHFSPGGSLISLADLAMLMIVHSDNVATNLLIDRLTAAAINEQLNQLGLVETQLRRHMMDFNARNLGFENTSTPSEALRLMLTLQRGSDEKGNKESSTAAKKVLETLRLEKESPFASALPTTATVANKPGMLEGLRTEWALVADTTSNGGPIQYGVALMIESQPSGNAKQDNSNIKQAMYQLGSLIHEHWAKANSN